MYKEKWLKGFRGKSGKSIALLVSLVLIIGVIVGGAIAFLIDTTGSVNNQFTPSKVTTYVDETVRGDTKTNVKIQNTGDTEAWIRAAVVVTWQNEKGEVYGQAPVTDLKCKHDAACTCDYAIEYVTDSSWKKSNDGFYYWTKPVVAKGETGVLIKSCTYKANAPDGYSLTVEIIGSGIQSVPTSVVTEEWSSGVSGVSDDTLTIKQ